MSFGTRGKCLLTLLVLLLLAAPAATALEADAADHPPLLDKVISWAEQTLTVLWTLVPAGAPPPDTTVDPLPPAPTSSDEDGTDPTDPSMMGNSEPGG